MRISQVPQVAPNQPIYSPPAIPFRHIYHVLSRGMQQKIQFISTVVHEPKLLILDEPFAGLDPINTNLIKKEKAFRVVLRDIEGKEWEDVITIKVNKAPVNDMIITPTS